MKQRLVVMNGQRIVQTEQSGGTWANSKVDKAGALRPGIYNLYAAVPASKTDVNSGVILHSDDKLVYQQIGKGCVTHERAAFERVPDVGAARTITYGEEGRVKVSVDLPALSRGRSR